MSKWTFVTMPQSYKKLKLLGAGSFGEAWLARPKNCDRYFVIKEMKLLPNLKQEERDRINNEVKIIRGCSHMNIIKYKALQKLKKIETEVRRFYFIFFSFK